MTEYNYRPGGAYSATNAFQCQNCRRHIRTSPANVSTDKDGSNIRISVTLLALTNPNQETRKGTRRITGSALPFHLLKAPRILRTPEMCVTVNADRPVCYSERQQKTGLRVTAPAVFTCSLKKIDRNHQSHIPEWLRIAEVDSVNLDIERSTSTKTESPPTMLMRSTSPRSSNNVTLCSIRFFTSRADIGREKSAIFWEHG